MELTSGDSLASTSSGPGESSSDTCDPGAASCSTEDPNPRPRTPSCRQSSRLKAKRSHATSDSAVPAESNGPADAPAPGRGRKRGGEGADEGQEKYNLRLSSLVKRVQVERKHAAPKEPRGKSRPPPLSKYRRRTANARERMRMRDINEGFERLKSCLPELEDQTHKGRKEKVTKFMILSLALNYIHALREMLGYAPITSEGDATRGIDAESCSDGGHDCSDSTAESPVSTDSNSCASSSSSSSSSKTTSSSNSACGDNASPSNSASSNNSSSKDSNNNINNSISNANTEGIHAISPAASKDSEAGSDAARKRALSASFSSACSSASSDDLCSTPSPAPSVLDLKEYYLPYTPLASDLGSCDVTLASALQLKNFVGCSASSVPAGMEVRGDVLCSPSPSLSSNSLSPPPPPLGLPEDCLVFGDPALCLDLPVTLSTLQDCIDMGL